MKFDGDQESSFVGAIFMASRSTKRECLKRNLFGLPPSQHNFVKKVKSGMVLFLFEYEERKLFGVFQASSDGDMNIVPHAFLSSGKQFPSQVRFKTIWYCEPLSERDFCGAIRDNYYTANKFNIGLSRYQVSDLLWLFDSRRMKVQKSKSLVSRDIVENRFVKNCGRRGALVDDKHILGDSGKNRLAMDDEPINLAKYPGLCRSNPNVSVLSDKQFLEQGNSIFGGQRGLSSIECSSMKQRSPNLLFCAPLRDGAVEQVNDLYSTSFRSKTGFSAVDSSVGIADKNSPQALASYPKNSADGLFPFSRSKVVPFLVETENSNLPPMRSGSLSIPDSFGDYIPLDSINNFECTSPSILFPETLSSRCKSVDPTNLQVCRGLTFPEPSLTSFPPSRHLSFGRKDMGPSFSRGEDPSTPDVCRPERLRHEEPLYTNCEPSCTIFPNKFHLQVGFDPLDSQSTDSQGELEQDKPTSPYPGLRSDIPDKRPSVFSRLNVKKVASVPDDDEISISKHVDLSVNQIMDTLYTYEKIWGKSTKKSQCRVMKNYVDYSSNAEDTHNVCKDSSLPSEEKQCNLETVEEIPINFRRRSKIRKVQSEAGGCSEESEGLPAAASHKRRKLIRPSFASGGTDDKGAVGENCGNGSSEEMYKGKVGRTGEVVVGSDGGQGNGIVFSGNCRMQIVGQPVSFEHNSGRKGRVLGSDDLKLKVEAAIQELNGLKDHSPSRNVLTQETCGNGSTQKTFVSEIGGSGEALAGGDGDEDNEIDLSENLAMQIVSQPVSFEQNSGKKGRVLGSEDLKLKVKVAIQELNGLKDQSLNQKDTSNHVPVCCEDENAKPQNVVLCSEDYKRDVVEHSGSRTFEEEFVDASLNVKLL
ncbi:hypothetical protein IFM89_022087 [Coptis chinensis]|uniref:DCD domain-containing protein n=1 Tax=Coptis chinensis TaxID=261450 RepID=A0A835IBU0_9MAGN|nr:hypothetical protein IFM89_022087 [Coptis chinensis]